MPTDNVVTSRRGRDFALRFVAWSLALFGVLRFNWIETYCVLPVTRFQGAVATRLSSQSSLPVEVTLACSGADAMALCAGAILAYPASWPRRLVGAAGGIGLLLVLNIARIGTLGWAVEAAPGWFHPLHVYVWPALLMLGTAAYVFAWMRFADRPTLTRDVVPALSPAGKRFVWLTALLLVLFIASSPLYLESAGVLAVATFIAQAGAWLLGLIGVQATVFANTLATAQGGFTVTQECISTPLIPVYLAAVMAYSRTWPRALLALAAAAPLFVGLGIARLLVVALPFAVAGSPLFLVHAFYQLLLAAVLVVLVAMWRQGTRRTAWRRALAGGVLGVLLAWLVGPLAARVLDWVFAGGARLADPQGAIAFLPSFQLGLYVALSAAAFVVPRWRPFVIGLALLALSQVALFGALEWAARAWSVAPHVRDVRAWAVVGPLLLVMIQLSYDRPRR